MIESLSNLFFGCRHRRMSFPQRPVTRPGEPQEDMYVVCLDCAKRFQYDWERMCIGAPVGTAVIKRPKFRYVITACALPVLWLIGKMAMSQRRLKPEKEQKSEPKH
jgi:hypothetical protein